MTNEKQKTNKNIPLMETTVSKSKDGRFVITRTTITDIRPIEYFKKVVGIEVPAASTEKPFLQRMPVLEEEVAQ